MKVLLLAPAQLSSRADLSRLVTAGREDLLSCISRAEPPGWEVRARRAGRSDRVIDDQQAADDALVPAELWRGRWTGAVAPPGHLREAPTATVTSHGVVVVRALIEVAGAQELRSAEDSLQHWAEQQLSVICDAVGSAVSASGGHLNPVGADRDMRLDTFLWWHRVFLDDVPDDPAPTRHLAGSSTADLGPGCVLRVANGYSQLTGADAATVEAVTDGLVLATQVWLVADRLHRRLTEHAALLLAVRAEADLERQQADAARLTDQASLEAQVLLEEVRYTGGQRLATVEAACAAWRTDADLGSLVSNIERVRDAVERRVQEQRDARADRLNRLLAGLTVVGALAVVLAVFETAVGDALPAEVAVVRAVVAALVVAVGVAALAVTLRSRR